jgi:hypothetical protein
VAVKVQRPNLLFNVARDVYILRIGVCFMNFMLYFLVVVASLAPPFVSFNVGSNTSTVCYLHLHSHMK